MPRIQPIKKNDAHWPYTHETAWLATYLLSRYLGNMIEIGSQDTPEPISGFRFPLFQRRTIGHHQARLQDDISTTTAISISRFQTKERGHSTHLITPPTKFRRIEDSPPSPPLSSPPKPSSPRSAQPVTTDGDGRPPLTYQARRSSTWLLPLSGSR